MKKITRRTVLRASGLAAASLALSGCAPTGSACVGNGFSDWLQQTFGKSDSAASSESTEAAAPDAEAASEAPAESADSSLPAYNADPLTGEPRRSNGRMVGVMVNNTATPSGRTPARSAALALPTCSSRARWRAASPASARCTMTPMPSRK